MSPIPPESIPLHDTISDGIIHLGTRQVPEIDGSQGGFIGLVVSLSVLIVVCCAAVFYLLRHHEPTEQDRAARRERYLHTREHTLSSNSTTSGFGSLGDKVKQLWQSSTSVGRRRGGRGWIRAGSDDGWASHSDHEEGVDPELGRLRAIPSVMLKQDANTGGNAGAGAGASAGAGAGSAGATAVAHGTRDVGVRIVESPSSDSTSGFHAQGYVYMDPFSKTVAEGAVQQAQSPLSSPVSSPRETESVEESHEARSPVGDRHRSTMSNASVWTHGSRFIEDI